MTELWASRTALYTSACCGVNCPLTGQLQVMSAAAASTMQSDGQNLLWWVHGSCEPGYQGFKEVWACPALHTTAAILAHCTVC